METNESILTRKVVGIDDRKLLGTVSELRVDCDALAVGHYIVGSASTNSPLALPFEKALSVGDTFVTIQSRNDFVPAGTSDAQVIVRDGFKLLGCEAFTRTGNALGTVKSYEFDPVFGTVTSLTLDNGSVFAHDAFVFFSPEFVFVDDGSKTAAELRAAHEAGKDEAPVEAAQAPEIVEDTEEEPAAAEEYRQPSLAALAQAFGQPIDEEPSVDVEPEPETEPEPEPEPEAADAIDVEADASKAVDELDDAEVSEVEEAKDEDADVASEHIEADEEKEAGEDEEDEDADVIALLMNAVLTDDVTSRDGAFTAAKGTVLTRDVIDEARAHDALLLLVMSVEE